MTHYPHIRIYASEDMVIAEPGERDDALDIRRMGAGDERAHGGNLVAMLTEHVTIVITRACVIIGIDEPPAAKCGIRISKSKTIIIRHTMVHTQTVSRSNGLLRIANRPACNKHTNKRE